MPLKHIIKKQHLPVHGCLKAESETGLSTYSMIFGIHNISKKIQKEKGEELIKQVENILYQDNVFLGILSLYGVLREKDVIHNILFPQLE